MLQTLANKPAGHRQHPPELWCDSMECGNVTVPWGDTRAHGWHGVWSAGMLLYTMVQLHLLSSGAQKPLLAGALPAAVPDAGRGRTDLSWLWALMLWLTVQGQRVAVLVRREGASGHTGAFGGKFGGAPGWGAGDDMLDHVRAGGGELARSDNLCQVQVPSRLG